MKVFLRKNKIFLAAILGAVIIAIGAYAGLAGIGFRSQEAKNSEKASQCQAPSETIVTKVIDGDTVVLNNGKRQI